MAEFKMVKRKDIQVKFFPPGTHVTDIPMYITHQVNSTPEKAAGYLRQLQDNQSDVYLPLNCNPRKLYNGVRVTSPGIWIFGVFEPEFNALGEISL